MIELLVTFTILVIVLALVNSIISFSVQFFSFEDSEVLSQESLRLVAVSFEKDVRKSNAFSTNGSGCFVLAGSVDGTITYCLTGTNIYRNDVVVVKGIQVFSPSYDPTNDVVSVLLETVLNRYEKSNSVNYIIYMRRGG